MVCTVCLSQEGVPPRSEHTAAAIIRQSAGGVRQHSGYRRFPSRPRRCHAAGAVARRRRHSRGWPANRQVPRGCLYLRADAESVVTLTLAGYHPWHGLARRSRDDSHPECDAHPSSAEPAPSATGRTAGATVFLDNQQTATTPGTIQCAGQHVVEYRHAGFYPFREEVTVTPGRTPLRAGPDAPRTVSRIAGRWTTRATVSSGSGRRARAGVRPPPSSGFHSNVPQAPTPSCRACHGNTALIGSRRM